MRERYRLDRELEALEVRRPTRKISEINPIDLCKGYQHTIQPMKRDKTEWVPDGPETALTPLDPGFLDSTGGIKHTMPLQTQLKELLADPWGDFKKYITEKSGVPSSSDRILVALVDLSGKKLFDPELAEWGSNVAVNGWSAVKVAPLYAAFQLLNDLKALKGSTTIADLAKEAKKTNLPGPPQLNQFINPHSVPPDIEFSDLVDQATKSLINPEKANCAARFLIDIISFPYIACLMLNSGLYHPDRGGIWLKVSFGCGSKLSTPFPAGQVASWTKNVIRPKKQVYFYNVTALSLATFYTLLAQRRLVTPTSSDTIRNGLTQASWFNVANGGTLPDSSRIASKVGLNKRCIKWGPKTKDGRRVLDKMNKPVLECKKWIATHAHEAGLIENGHKRYAVAIMTVGIPDGVTVIQRLIGKLDVLIR